MKAEEFCIGNIVNFQKHRSVLQGKVVCITRYKVTFDTGDSFKLLTRENDKLLPIPLDENWLSKFGFEWDIFWQGITNGKFVLFNNHLGGYRLASCKNRNYVIIDNIMYVHQFQNLNYVLSGKELK